jgi:hypothetical protein
MADKKGIKKTVNYDFMQKEPSQNMGQGSFAQLPDQPIMRPYGRPTDMRSGVINSFPCGIEDISGIYENQAE